MLNIIAAQYISLYSLFYRHRNNTTAITLSWNFNCPFLQLMYIKICSGKIHDTLCKVTPKEDQMFRQF